MFFYMYLRKLTTDLRFASNFCLMQPHMRRRNYDATSVRGSDFDIQPGNPVPVIEPTARALATAKEKLGGKVKGKMKVSKPMKLSLTSWTAR
jgi:hypothetical protein